MAFSVTDTFEVHRSQLTGLAYRITGSLSEAEDIAHETFIKWFGAEHDSIDSPYSWLMAVATRLSLDYLKSARVQRQSYIGQWLPEPYVSDNKTPESERELDDSITMALLVLLEQLSPAERASFILHDIFSFSFNEIGGMLGKTDSACRKLASRVRSKVDKDAIKSSMNKDEHRDVVSAFFGAVKTSNMAELVSLLKDDVVLRTDGGGKAPAVLEMLEGLDTVSGFLLETVRPGFVVTDSPSTTVTDAWFNGSPGLVIWDHENPVSAFNFDIEEQRIIRIHVLRNPDKLKLFETHAV